MGLYDFTGVDGDSDQEVKYFKIFSYEKQAWWKQNKFGYTDETNAGFWPKTTIDNMALDDAQKIVPFTPARLTLKLIDMGLYDFTGVGEDN